MLDPRNASNYKRSIVSREDMEYAHDFLADTLDDDELIERLGLEEIDIEMLAVALSVLCWIFGHDNQTFAEGMAELEKMINQADGMAA